jgi:hypothetical protein
MANQIEYKRYKDWSEMCAEEYAVHSKLKAEGKLRAMDGTVMMGMMIEHALNRLGKDGWKLCYVHKNEYNNRSNIIYGIFLAREVSSSPAIPKIEDLIGPTAGNKEARLPITP